MPNERGVRWIPSKGDKKIKDNTKAQSKFKGTLRVRTLRLAARESSNRFFTSSSKKSNKFFFLLLAESEVAPMAYKLGILLELNLDQHLSLEGKFY